MKDFWNDKVVVITGASSGIGLALLENLSHYPCKIFALARRANDIKDPALKHAACEVIRIGLDLQDGSSISDALAILQSHTSDVDVLFNNAGITAHGRFDELSMDVYRKTFATNFFGPIQLIQGLLGGLKKRREW